MSVTDATNGIAAVQARMVELRALLDPTSVSSTTGTSGSTGTSSGGEATFAAALASAQATAVDDSASIAPGSGVTGEALVAAASTYLGTPYVWGGESLDEGGLDCSGLVQRSLADLGITDVPRVARDQMKLGTEVASLDQAQPGDLVVFGGGTHIGIYVGDGKMIDAPKPGASVTIRDVYTEPSTIRRILPSAAAATSTASSASTVSSSLASALASTSAGRSALALLGGSSSSSAATSLSSLLGSSSSSSTSLSALLGSATGSTSTSELSSVSSSQLAALLSGVSA